MQVAEPLALGAREPAGSATDYEMTAGASSSSWPAEEPASMELELQDADQEGASAMELEADTLEPELGATSEEVEMGEAELGTAEPADEEIVDYAEDDVPQASLDPGDEELAAASSPVPLEAGHHASEHADLALAPPLAADDDAPPAADAAPQSEEQTESHMQPAEQPADFAATAPELDESEAATSASALPSEPSAAAAAVDAKQDELEAAAETTSAPPGAEQQLAVEQHQEVADGSATHDDLAEQEDTAEAAEPSVDADETASEAAEADEADEDDDGTIDDQPPSIRLTFAGQDFVLFAADDCSEYLAVSESADAPESSWGTVAVAAPRLAAPTEAFHEGLDGLFEALRVRDSLGDFLEERTELVLNLPELELTVREDDVYAREVTLADLHRLHVGGGLVGSLHLVVSEAPRFISRYNLLAAELSVEDGDDTTASAEEELDALHDGVDEHGEIEGEEEAEAQHHADAPLDEQQHVDGEGAGDVEHPIEPTLAASHTDTVVAADEATDAASQTDESGALDAQVAEAAAEATEPAHAELTDGEHATGEAHDDVEEEGAAEAEETLEEYVEEEELEAQGEDAVHEEAPPEKSTEADAEGASLDDGAAAQTEQAAAEEQIVDYEEHTDEAALPSASINGDNVQYEQDASEHANGKRPFAEPDDEQDEASAKRTKVD